MKRAAIIATISVVFAISAIVSGLLYWRSVSRQFVWDTAAQKERKFARDGALPWCCDVQTYDQTYEACEPCKLPACEEPTTLLPTVDSHGNEIGAENGLGVLGCLHYQGLFLNGQCNDPRAYGISKNASYKQRCDASCGNKYEYKGSPLCESSFVVEQNSHIFS